MKILIALLLLLPSLSWGNHEVLICEDGFEYSLSKDHTILFINNSDGTTEGFNIIDSNEVWTYFKHFTDESRYRSFNKYTKQIDIPTYGVYNCDVYESD